MATLKFVLREDKTRKNGTAPVYLRITAHRRTSSVNTDIALEPRFWNQNRQRVRRSHPQAPVLNQGLDDLLKEAIKA